MSLNCGQSEFWDYSLDEFALFDIPNTIDYILSSTGEPALTFIGFSQGSAQALAALSMSSDLNKQVKLFIGISPATIPQRLPNPFAGIFTRFPDLLFYVLGHRSVLPSVIAFSAMVLGPFHRFIVDISLNSIFHWKTKNISRVQKEIGYPHLFSPSSVKSLVHWLQIISSNRFQMFDDACHSIFSKITCTSFKLHRVTPFPINNVSTNVMLVYGMCDVLVSVDPFEQRLDNCRELEIIGIENYEHMDTLWAQDVEFKVFKPVLEKINKINHGLMFDQYNDDVKVTEDLTNSSFNDLDQHYNSIVTKPVNININKDLGLSVEELPMSQSSLFV
jgi:lysosomal acid lipase/cholesteryl ester hydrolase